MISKARRKVAANLLDKAAKFLSQPNRWCQTFWARDKDGRRIDWDSEDAVKFCMVGAIRRCAKMPLTADLAESYLPPFHVRFNDEPGRKVKEVIKVLTDTASKVRKTIE